MPTGKVKWYDAEKGFGFLSQEEGEDVYVRASRCPRARRGSQSRSGVEFGLASGRRGPQALSVKLIDPPPSLSRTRREAAAAEHKHSPDELHGMVEDMITLLESAVQPELRKAATPTRRWRAGLRGGSRGRQRARRVAFCTAADGETLGPWVPTWPPAASSIATPTTSPPASPRTAGTAIPSSPAGTG